MNIHRILPMKRNIDDQLDSVDRTQIPHAQRSSDSNVGSLDATRNNLDIEVASIEIEADDLYLRPVIAVDEHAGEAASLTIHSDAAAGNYLAEKRSEIGASTAIANMTNRRTAAEYDPQIASVSNQEVSSADWDPLNCVRPEISEKLKHLDLTGLIDDFGRRVLKAGGYGDIFKGSYKDADGNPVKVAVKRLRICDSGDIKTLFEKEIYVWARLDHPNVLPLLGYAFDRRTGYPLLVSEWMSNGSAWDFVREHSSCDVIELVTGVASGLAYLHENGVVHSDLKSDNILITRREEAVICDFGCSRMISASQSLANITSQIKGTNRYLAIELLTVPGSKHSLKTDVWAFGMTAFELLTRQRPYEGMLDVQIMLAIMNKEVPRLPPFVKIESLSNEKKMLWEICQLCWNPDPEGRIDMKKIILRLKPDISLSTTERSTPGVFDNSDGIASFSFDRSGLQTSSMAVSSVLHPRQHDIATRAKLSEEARVKKSKQPSHDTLALFSRISESLKTLNLTNAENLDLNGALEKHPEIVKLFLPIVRDVVVRDGRGEGSTSLLKDVLAEIYCVTLHRPLSEAGLLDFLQALHPEVTSDQLCSTFSLLHPLVVKAQTLFPPLLFLEFLSDENRSGLLYVDLRKVHASLAQRCLDILRAQLKFNICALESSHSRNVDVADLEIRIQRSVSEVLQYSSLYWMNHTSQADESRALRGPLRNFFCSSNALHWIEVLSLLGALEVGKDMLLKCVEHFKEDYEIVHAATELQCFVYSFSATMEISTPQVYVSALSWMSKDSFVTNRCFWPSSRKSLLVTDVKNGDSLGINHGRDLCDSDLAKNLKDALCLAYSSNWNRVATGHRDRSLRIWDGQSGEFIVAAVKGGHWDAIIDIAFSPDGTRIVSVSKDKTLCIWSTQNGALIVGPRERHLDMVWSVTYSSNGRRIVSGSFDGTIRIWDAQSGALLRTFTNGIVVLSTAFSPDGRRISASVDCAVRIWDVESGTLVYGPLTGHEAAVGCVAYSPDGSRVVSGSNDKTLRIWNVQCGSPVGGPLKGHEGRVADVKYSHDGSRIVSWSWDETLRFWNALSGAPLGVVHRGESRWDSDNNCFISIPNWWPAPYFGSPRTMPFFDNLDAPLQVPEDGWLRTLDGGLFVWVPQEYRRDVSGRNPRLKIDWRKVRHGKDWTKIMDVEDHST